MIASGVERRAIVVPAITLGNRRRPSRELGSLSGADCPAAIPGG